MHTDPHRRTKLLNTSLLLGHRHFTMERHSGASRTETTDRNGAREGSDSLQAGQGVADTDWR
jgi:hypothetical protein